jgi:cephalosporin-C deacetylase-like acetyl esterase
MKGKFYNAYMAMNEQTKEDFNEFWENLLQNGEGRRKQKFIVRSKEIWALEYYRVVMEDTRPTKVVIMVIDKTKEKELNERLKAEIESRNTEE